MFMIFAFYLISHCFERAKINDFFSRQDLKPNPTFDMGNDDVY
jgi:hypothetical protein